MKKLLIFCGICLLLSSCKEGEEGLSPNDAVDRHFSEQEERIFDLINSRRFSNESGGSTFLDSDQTGNNRLNNFQFTLNIDGEAIPFNYVRCDAFYLEGDYQYNEMAAAYVLDQELIYSAGVLFDFNPSLLGRNEIRVYFGFAGKDYFASFNSDHVSISNDMTVFDEVLLRSYTIDLNGNLVDIKYISMSGTITCPS